MKELLSPYTGRGTWKNFELVSLGGRKDMKHVNKMGLKFFAENSPVSNAVVFLRILRICSSTLQRMINSNEQIVCKYTHRNELEHQVETN